MKKILYLVLFVLVSQYSTGQQIHVRIDSLCRNAYSAVLSLHFAPARKLLNHEKQKHPANVYTDYLYNYMDFLRIFISEDQNLFDRLDDTFDLRYGRIKQLPDTSRYKNLLLANMNLQWAFARLKFGQYFTAAWELNKAYRLITENNERFPGFVPNNITLGILHVIIGLVPDKYQWMLKIISMEGNVEQGKAELYRALDQAAANPTYAYLYHESLFYLGFIELNLSANQNTLNKLMKYLRKTDADNLLMDFLKADIYIRHGKNDKALDVLRNAPRGSGYFPFYYLNYLQGECYLRKLSTDSADAEYHYFLHHFRGLNYIKDAWRKRAWDALLHHDSVTYRRRMDSVIRFGSAKVGADKEALTEAERGRIPNIDLLRVRLLFDGGYYSTAKSILTQMDTAGFTDEEKTEYIYRFARITHRLHQIPQAKKAYRETLATGSRLPRYFAANAALKLGEIYESEDSLTLAQKFYRECLNLPFDEYVNSIRGKAKEALQRITEKQKAISAGN